MKKDKVNKRKMNTYLKYGLIMLAAMIFGGFLGGGMSYLNHGAPLGQTIQDAAQMLVLGIRERMFFILLILFVVCIIWNEWALHQMKAIEQRLEGVEEEDENDRLEYDLDRIYGITNIVHNIFMILDILILSTSYSAHYIDTVEDWQAYFWLAGMVVFVITFLYIGICFSVAASVVLAFISSIFLPQQVICCTSPSINSIILSHIGHFKNFAFSFI